jgi:hypothetical protein
MMNYDEIIKTLSDKANFNSRTDTATKLSIIFYNKEAWKSRVIPGLSPMQFETFMEFVTYRTPWGLGWTEQMLKAFIWPEEKKLWADIELELPELYPNGENPKYQPKVEALTCKGTTYGNTRTYKIAKLKRDAPEYAEKVIRGEISANRAMVESGLELEKVTIPVDVNAFCNAIKRKFSPLEIQQLKDLL